MRDALEWYPIALGPPGSHLASFHPHNYNKFDISQIILISLFQHFTIGDSLVSRMKFLLIFCALIPHVYVIIFIRPFTAHKSIFHISSHGRGDVIFVNCVLTLAIPFLFSCNCARPVNLGVQGAEAQEEGGGSAAWARLGGGETFRTSIIFSN